MGLLPQQAENGNSTVNVEEPLFNGQASFGNGNNSFYSSWFNGQAIFGNGDNSMLMGNLTSNGTITARNGNNEVGIRSANGGNLVLGGGVNSVGILYGNLGIQGGPHTNAYYAQLADSGYQLPEDIMQAHDESTRRQDVADMMAKLRDLLERPYE